MSTIIKCFGTVLIAATIFSCNSNDYKKDEPVVTVVNDTPSSNMQNNMPPGTGSTNMSDTPGGTKMTKDGMDPKDKNNTKGKKANITVAAMADPTYSKRKMEKMEMDKQGYYGSVEVWPSYPGGDRAMEKFFNDNIEYPEVATENNTEGLVTISFMVDEAGKVSSPSIISKKVGDGVEEEALRVFNKMPTWMPGQIKGKNVKTRYTLPVRFQLQ